MTPFEIGLIALGALGVLVMLGLHISIALIACSFGGVWAIKGTPILAAKLLAGAANDSIANYFFGVIPLFVLMGLLVAEARLGSDAFDVASSLFRRVKGGLAVGTVGANAVFAAVTGVSIASCAVFTKVAVPPMRAHGYSARFAVGVVAGSSVLGMLIPPSFLLILFGILTETSIGDLFLAGILPGLLLSCLFAIGIVAFVFLAPKAAGQLDEHVGVSLPFGELASKGLPIVALILLVLGGIYSGLFTPVEAGAMGSIGALILGLLRGRLGARAMMRVLVETGLITASVCFLIIAAQMYSRMLAFSGVPAEFGSLAASAGLPLLSLIVIYLACIILMGMILDSASILLIMVPLMLPVVVPMGVDLVWFGIITVIAVEVGLLTPPFGLSVFVIKATLDDPSIKLSDIFIGAAPFAAMIVVVLALVVAFPPLATALL